MEFPGVFVPGSNDYYAPKLKNPARYLLGPSKAAPDREELDWPRLRAGFGMGGWIDLTNRHQSIVLNGLRFDFSGVDDPHLNRERYAGWPRGTRGQNAKDHLRVAVIHAPYQRVLDHFTEDGADLLLAGHTHGGQLCIPGYGALVANCDIPHLAGQGPQRLEQQRAYDAGQRLRRDRHLALCAGPHRLQARGRPADAHPQRLTSRL
jgi:predicted MPP superfamily phosphohydrolase